MRQVSVSHLESGKAYKWGTIGALCGNHYKPDSALNKIRDLKEIGTVQKYRKNINGGNVYAKIKDYNLFNIIFKGITRFLH